MWSVDADAPVGGVSTPLWLGRPFAHLLGVDGKDALTMSSKTLGLVSVGGQVKLPTNGSPR